MSRWLLVAGLICVASAAARTGAEKTPPPPGVYRDQVEPQWLSDNTRFWYRLSTGRESYEFIVVDAAKGLRRPAFDHARLGQVLTHAGVEATNPDRLPLERLEFDATNGALHFLAGGKGWRCDLATYGLESEALTNRGTASGLPLDNLPRASLRTGDDTTLTFINRTSAEVELFWLSTEGERQSYGKLAPGESRDQHTFAGHVWLALDGSGKVLAAFEARERATEAEIGGGQPVAPARPRNGLRRRNRPNDTSPDGHWRAFVREHNLAIRELTNGVERILTTNGTAEDAYEGRAFWSPDSKRVVMLRTRKGEEHKVYLIESSPKDQLQPRLQSIDYPKAGDRIPLSKPHLFEVGAGAEIPIDDALFPNPWSIEDVRWSPDSSRFTFLYNQRGHQVLRILAVDAATGKVSPIVEERSRTFIDYSGKQFAEYLDNPIGSANSETAPAASGAQTNSPEIIWMSERDGWNHLYLYDALSGRVKNQITRGPWVVRGVERVDAQRRQIWFRAGGIRPGQDPYYIHYARVNFDGSGLVILTEGDGSHSIQYSPDQRYFVDTWSRVDLAPIHELRRGEDGALVCRLEEADPRELTASGWRPPQRFVAKGRDGETDIYGILHWPETFDPAKKYRVIEHIYAGPQGSFVPKTFHASFAEQKLANHGFIIAQIDGMGTSDRSKKFHDVCWKNLGDAGFPDRILWLKAAAKAYPSLDLERVGIYGTSAGGQSALRAMLAFGDFYGAAVADSGCHDNRMDKIWWNEQWMGWPVGPHYAEQSNVTQAHKLRGPLLLMAGELDKNVDPASTMQVVNALIKANKNFELLVVPGAGHGILGSPYGQQRLEEFFVRNLGR